MHNGPTLVAKCQHRQNNCTLAAEKETVQRPARVTESEKSIAAVSRDGTRMENNFTHCRSDTQTCNRGNPLEKRPMKRTCLSTSYPVAINPVLPTHQLHLRLELERSPAAGSDPRPHSQGAATMGVSKETCFKTRELGRIFGIHGIHRRIFSQPYGHFTNRH